MNSLRYILLGALAVWSGTGHLGADDPAKNKTAPQAEAALPAPGDVQQLTAHPTSVTLIGSDDSAQLIVSGGLSGGRSQDLSGDAKYEVADAKVAQVTPSGRIIPLANGKTTVTARYGAKTATVAIEAKSQDVNLPINFTNHIVPIFTKLGCNSGGCHGKSGGQNGFALSLLGFVPELDYQSLVKDQRGSRRIFPSSPENSLLLLKASGGMAHAGGKRMETDSDEFKLIRRWIASGTPLGNPDDPVVTKITVHPEQRVVSRHNRQQIAVYAHYSDGTVFDVTQRAQYESNDTDIAIVDGSGLVRSLEMAGEAGVMTRYQGQVAVFRATIPLGMKIPEYQFTQNTLVDKHVHKKFQELGIVPSELCSDEIFIRRVSVDITGSLPSPEKVKAFLADKDSQKRDKLIDALLETPEYSYYFANKWADILRVKRGNQPNRAFGTFAFHNWIRESIALDKPYDQFAREILAAIGDEAKSPPTVWYKDLTKPEQFVDDTAQLFLGVRMACAQCHHHPYEKWSQDDYWGMAAFFSQIGRKTVPVIGQVIQNQQNQRQVIFNKGNGTVINTRTNKTAVMKAPDGPVIELKQGEDPRHRLVDWMVDAKNPFFARSVANRYWAHFFGRGIVDPLDDMRVTNPPSNPDLLDALAKDLLDNKFSLKHMIKTMVKSRTYQLSALPNEFNKHDKRAYARYYPRRMSAEVVFDAVCSVTNSPALFPGLPNDKHSPNRAIMLPDESFRSYFLDVMGRPLRQSACECERVTEANLAQALHMLNSDEIQQKLTRAGGRAELMTKDPRKDEEKVTELFLWALSRPPSADQLRAALDHLAEHSKNKKPAYEDIIWGLINTKEFILVQ